MTETTANSEYPSKEMEICQREFANYTIVMVSHRLDMVIDFDKVLIMDKGSIIESGNPRELIEREGSSFKELWAVGRHQI
jgi:ATP-binding cassette subfamily C (CFTR/MRP) protein 1